MKPLNKKEISLTALKSWFEDEKRNFPWRINPTPYRVWVSEVMLQQTQASVVIPYFDKWMQRLPTIESLAKATEEEVIKLWEGLGYYARARSLHHGARYLLEHHGGKLPADRQVLEKIKGLGPYTIGAILSFAFQKKAAAVDGNVLRVMSRLLAIEDEIDRPKVRNSIEQAVLKLLPDEDPWVTMEALIELGAQVCKRKATCMLCPLREECSALALGKVDELPKKKKGRGVTILHRDVFIIECEGSYLIQKHKEPKIMAGLWEFPFFEKGIQPSFFSHIENQVELTSVTHTFTRYKAHLYPTIWKASYPFLEKGFVWVESKRLSELAFSSGHRKILKEILERHANITY